jgi:hypothetical protein
LQETISILARGSRKWQEGMAGDSIG